MAGPTFGGRGQGNNPSGVRQRTEVLLYDTVAFNGATQLTDQALFSGGSKPLQYRNVTFPAPAGRLYKLTHIQALYNMQFADPVSGDAGTVAQDYFEKFSYLEFSIEDRSYPLVPLTSILTSSLALTDATLSRDRHTARWFKLKYPIEVPEAGQIEFHLRVPQSLTTATITAGANASYLPGLGLTLDKGFFVKFHFRGELDRPGA